MRRVGFGGEFVDHCRVDGVLALLRALDVAVLAAPFAKEVALRLLRYAHLRQPPSATSAVLRRLHDAALRVLQESQLFQYSPSGLREAGLLHLG